MGVNGIYGLSGSGLDVESMVKTAMKAKQAQYDKMYKKEVKQEWIKSAYNDFYNSLSTFKYTTLSNYKMQSNMNAMKATSNNNSVVTVTANGEAASMSHNVKVNALASNAYLQTTSAGIKRDNTSSGKSINLRDIVQNDLPGGGIDSYNSNNDTIKLKDGTFITEASQKAVLSFKVKDAATETTSKKYTTTTTDAKGNTISGFAPVKAGETGSFTASDGNKYVTRTTDDAATGSIKTELFYTTDGAGKIVPGFMYPKADGKSTYTDVDTATTYASQTKTNSDGTITTDLYLTKDQDGNVISGFFPTADGNGTYSDGSKNYTSVTKTNSDGTVTTTLTSNDSTPVTKTYTTTKQSYTTQTQTFTTTTVNADTQDKVPLYRPVTDSSSTAKEGSDIYQTGSWTTTTKDQDGKIVSGFFPDADGTGTKKITINGVDYTPVTTTESDGSITTALKNGSTTAFTYHTTTSLVNDPTTINNGFRPDASTAVVNDDGTISTLPTSTTTTTAINEDGSVSSTVTTNAPTGGKVVSYSYKDLYEKTLNDLAVDITSANGNITAVYDTVNDSMSLYNKNGGAANMVSISAFTGTYVNSNDKTVSAATSTKMTNDLFTHLSLGMYDGKKLNDAQTMSDTNSLSAVGVSGSVTVDGKLYNNLTSNKTQIAGVSYNLTATGSTTVSVTQDTDTVVKNVKQFVDDYNKIIDSLNDKIYETNYVSGSKSTTSYDPLTDAEKKGMSDSEVTSWEAKAKTGLLYHSSELMSIVSSMRSSISTPVDAVSSKYNTLGSIGISTTTDKGHIQLDETKLKNALAEDPDCVYQLFASSPSKDTDTANMGVANRLDLAMKNGLKAISNQAGTAATTNDQSTLGVRITSMKDKMKAFQEMMDDYQTRLYKQYDAMETALAKLNSQSSYVSSAFG